MSTHKMASDAASVAASVEPSVVASVAASVAPSKLVGLPALAPLKIPSSTTPRPGWSPEPNGKKRSRSPVHAAPTDFPSPHTSPSLSTSSYATEIGTSKHHPGWSP